MLSCFRKSRHCRRHAPACFGGHHRLPIWGNPSLCYRMKKKMDLHKHSVMPSFAVSVAHRHSGDTISAFKLSIAKAFMGNALRRRASNAHPDPRTSLAVREKLAVQATWRRFIKDRKNAVAVFVQLFTLTPRVQAAVRRFHQCVTPFVIEEPMTYRSCRRSRISSDSHGGCPGRCFTPRGPSTKERIPSHRARRRDSEAFQAPY